MQLTLEGVAPLQGTESIVAVDGMSAPKIRGPSPQKRNVWEHVLSTFSFISDQPGLPPAVVESGQELSWSEGGRRSLTSHTNMAGQAP